MERSKWIAVAGTWALLGLCAAALWAQAGAGDAAKTDPAVVKAYEEKWASEERQARGNDERVALAQQLLNRSRGEFDEDMAIYMCERAYLFGSRQRNGYGTAAQALKRIQEIDYARRLDCLIKLQPLYDRAYGMNKSTAIGLGKGLSQVYMQIADAYLDTLLDIRQPDEQSLVSDTMNTLKSAQRYYALSLSTANEVSARTHSLLNNPTIKKKQENVEKLNEFLEGVKELEEHAKVGVQETKTEHLNWNRLRVAQVKFGRGKSPENAKELIDLYLIVEQPEHAARHADHLSDDHKKLLPMMAGAVETVEPEVALAIGEWYKALADSAWQERKVDMLIRAKLYYEQAGDDVKTRVTLATINSQLAQLGYDSDRADRVARDVRYQLAQAPADEGAHDGHDHGPAAPSLPQPKPNPTPRPDPGDVQPPQGNPPDVKPAPAEPDPAPGDDGKMRICKKCFSRFEHGGSDETLCANCRGGGTAKIRIKPPNIRTCKECFADFDPRGSTSPICPNCAKGNSSIFDFD